MSDHKPTKAEQARINGAKSKGPKTEAGRQRSAAAKFKHGLYAVNASVLDIESREAFNVLRDAAFAQWSPRNPFEAQYVEEIADCSWRIARLRLCATHENNVSIIRLRQAATKSIRYLDAITKAEVESSSLNGPQIVIQRRVDALIRNRQAVSAELRALKSVISLGRTNDVLKLQELPAGFNPDSPHQTLPDSHTNQEETQCDNR